jgi:DNA-binding NarL/FixJ family response regulator
MLKKLLERCFKADVFQASTMAEARGVIRANNLDLVALDLQLKDSGIEETIEEIRSIPYPTFVYSGFDDPGLRERVLNAGAEDFILKATGDASIIERIGHLQYKRTGGKGLLKAAYDARHGEPARVTRSEWKGTIPRAVAAIISGLMFASGIFTGVWAVGKAYGSDREQQRQHFDKLDTAIVEMKAAGTTRDAILAELQARTNTGVAERQAIREQMRAQNETVIDWLKRIEAKVDRK